MKRNRRFSLVLLFLAALLSGIGLTVLLRSSAAAVGVDGAAANPRRILPLTAHGKVTQYDAAGNITSTEEFTRYQSASGDWRVVTTRNGKSKEQFFAQGRGFFTVDRGRGRLVKDGIAADQVSTESPGDMSNFPQFHHTEQMLGHTAYVLRVYDPETGILMGDSYTVPEWGKWSVKSVDYAAGGYVQSVKETLSVTEGEPAPEDVRGPADLPEVTHTRRR
jgi:hypothetical protein